MDCIVQAQNPLWTGALPQGLPSFQQRNYFSNLYFPQKRHFGTTFYPGANLFFPHDDEVDYPADLKGEMTMPYPGMVDNLGDIKLCVVCGERASGFYFGALVCLPCKSFYIRCTKDGEPTFTCQCNGNCDIVKQGRIRCQYCRYQRCLMAGMCRKEKPETVQPAEGQVLCKVCGDIANGIHFGVNTCEGCKKFFRRGLVENQSYICKGEKDCGINPRNRNNCRYCRYQKCLCVGMSREAIKMGRPKKADGSEISSPMTSNPKLARQPLVDVDNQTNLTNPQLGEDESTDSLKNSSVCNQIKKEAPSSCDYEKKWMEGQASSMSSWQPCSQGTMVPGSQCGPQNGPVNSSEFIEDDMDEILMMLQNDNQSGAPSKKMRGFSYTDMESAHRICKTEFSTSLPNEQQWRMSDMNSLAIRPPPQYPGYSHSYPTQNMLASPCQSPPTRQVASPGGYMSDTSVNSPGYIPNGSPLHSPSCQFSPQHSPMYQNSPSPQSPYQESQASPYNDNMYHPHPFSPDNSYHVTDLSVNVNCVQPQTVVAPGSPPQISPPFNSSHLTGQTNPSQPLTIPPQEGGGNSQEGWAMTGSPSFHCHSPSHNHMNQTSFPAQEGSYRRCSTRLENIQRINQHFMTGSSCDLQLIPDSECDGAMTRSDIEGEIVNKTLSSISPAESYYYVLSDSHSCSNDSGCNSSNYDEFTSCHRMGKRKSSDEFCDSPRIEQSSVGRFKRHLSEKYWHASVEVENTYPMTTNKQAVLEHLNKIFQQMTDRCSDTKQQMSQQDAGSWQQTRLRIVRNTSASVKFASQIPGFTTLHPEDKTFLCKTVAFMSSVLMAGQHLYGAGEHNFAEFWSWNISPRNPFYPFKQRLMEIGEKVHAANMDVYEVATLSALLYMASDFMDLAYPEAIEDGRRKIIAALKSYIMSKGVNVKSRLSELFSLVPEMRSLGTWHHELMKQMKINVQLQEVHALFDSVAYRES